MVARLQDDCEKLGKMVTIARQTSRALGTSAGTSSISSAQTYAPDSDRAALLGTSFKPVARVFGAAQPKETDETRPLDNGGLFLLQKSKMDQQDDKLSQLATILQRQKHLGEAIGAELANHIELLDGLSDGVDEVGGKLTSAKKQMNRLG
jgi:regulator of vacuolar morphogenesis